MTTSGAPHQTSDQLVLGAVRDVMLDLHPRRSPEVRLDSDLERDLGLDSLAVAELLLRLEQLTGTELSANVLRSASTPGDLVAAVAHASGKEPRSSAAPGLPIESGASPRTVGTLVESLDWHTATHPDRLHVRVLGENGAAEALTYGQLTGRARAVATGLLETGLTPGETVALMLPTGPDYFVTFAGVLLAGAIPVPIYPPARPSQLEEHLDRQRRILDNARAVLLVTVPEARRVAQLLRSSVESLRDIKAPDELPATGSTALPVPRPDDIALLQYTSGSTGNPKGVVLTHRNLLANIDAMAQAASVTADDVFVSWLPLYHDMGLIGAWLGSLHVGMPLVSMSPLSFLVHPARWLHAIDEHRATVSAAPNFAYELCLRKVEDADVDGLDLSSWRLAFNGAEAVHAETIRRFTERFGPHGFAPETLLPVYGLAEAAVGLAFPPIGRAPRFDRIRRSTLAEQGRAEPTSGEAETPAPDGCDDIVEVVSCGRPLPGYELRVVDDADRELPDRHEGHLQFRGPSATSGYYRNEVATEALVHDDWLDTGDLGYVADGDLFVTGRVKDLIIRAGRNLHPDELEDVVGRTPGIRRGCVVAFAATDPASATERLVIVAETRETAEDANARMRQRIVAATVDLLGTPPDEVVLASPGTVPKTSSGKIRRAETRARYESGELHPRQRSAWRQLVHFGIGHFSTRARRAGRAASDRLHAALGWVLLAVIGLPLCAVLAVLPGRRLRWAVARSGARACLRLARTPVRVHGPAIPAGPLVIVANHPSWIDGFPIIAITGEPVRFVAGEVLRGQRLAGTVLRRIDAVFVERWDRDQSVADAADLAELARAGERLVVFPEGHLSLLPGLRTFHLGGFLAAAAGGVPVVPVAIRGSRWILRPGTKHLRRGALDVVVGEPIVPSGEDWQAAIELRDAARAHIARHCGEPDLA